MSWSSSPVFLSCIIGLLPIAIGFLLFQQLHRNLPPLRHWKRIRTGNNSWVEGAKRKMIHMGGRLSRTNWLRYDSAITCSPSATKVLCRRQNARTEWWYMAGLLHGPQGATWAYHVAFFRHALLAFPKGRSVCCCGGNYLFAHFSLLFLPTGNFIFKQLGRHSSMPGTCLTEDCISLANKKWTLHHNTHELHLAISEKDLEVKLAYQWDHRGLIYHPCTDQNIQSEHYHSQHHFAPEVKAFGHLTTGGRQQMVHGESWMDREFGTGLLPARLRGWDWFCLTLNNDCHLTLSQLRDAQGMATQQRRGSLVVSGHSRTALNLNKASMKMTPLAWWQSSISGGCYPICWQIELPDHHISLRVQALQCDMEHDARSVSGLRYWEGPVCCVGRVDQTPVKGKGFMEMTGYCESLGGLF